MTPGWSKPWTSSWTSRGSGKLPLPFADLEKGGTFVTVLVTNDLVKRRLLQDYLTHVRAGEGKKNVVVCLESQEPRFRQVLLGVEFVSLPDSAVLDVKAAAGRPEKAASG